MRGTNDPWVKITKSGENYIYLTGFGRESDNTLQVSDTGHSEDFNEVVKKAKEFLVKRLWRSLR
jgi:hypothetical protein